MHCGVWKFSQQGDYQLFHCLALLWRSGVAGFAVLVKAANVADSYAVGVVSVGVCSRLFLGSAYLHSAVEQNYIVVAYHLKALSAVPAVYILGGECLSITGGRAM